MVAASTSSEGVSPHRPGTVFDRGSQAPATSSLAAAAALLQPRDDDGEPSSELQPAESINGDELLEGPQAFTFYDVFFWRDAPDWYRKTFHSAGFGLCYCVAKQYLNRQELEVFMPPRSKILPDSMQQGYRNSQMLKYGFLRVGNEVTTITGAALAYYAGAWYIGKWRGGVHSWENFAGSGAAAGAGVALWLLRPIKLRPIAFGVLLGAALGGAGAATQQALGAPLWDETHDFEGWWLGSRINLKADRVRAEQGTAGAGRASVDTQCGDLSHGASSSGFRASGAASVGDCDAQLGVQASASLLAADTEGLAPEHSGSADGRLVETQGTAPVVPVGGSAWRRWLPWSKP